MEEAAAARARHHDVHARSGIVWTRRGPASGLLDQTVCVCVCVTFSEVTCQLLTSCPPVPVGGACRRWCEVPAGGGLKLLIMMSINKVSVTAVSK